MEKDKETFFFAALTTGAGHPAGKNATPFIPAISPLSQQTTVHRQKLPEEMNLKNLILFIRKWS